MQRGCRAIRCNRRGGTLSVVTTGVWCGVRVDGLDLGLGDICCVLWGRFTAFTDGSAELAA